MQHEFNMRVLHSTRRSKRKYLPIYGKVICLNHPKMRAAKEWVLLHDNGLAQWLAFVQEKFTMHGNVVLPHASHSPDLTPCNFCLLLLTKNSLKGYYF